MRLGCWNGLTSDTPACRGKVARAGAGRAGASLVLALLLFAASDATAADSPAAISPAPATPPAAPAADPAESLWARHVEPVLSRSCVKCHGGSKQKGGLDLRQPQSVFAGGTDGSVVSPGRPGESVLYQRLLPGAQDHMPPEKEPPLSTEEVSFVREWIAMLPSPADRPVALGKNGAGGSGIDWNQSAPSLLELATRVQWQPPPGVEGPAAIDDLIQRRWRQEHVTGNDPCDDRTFARRVYLDLAGRIPTHGETDSFCRSTDAQKRAALVDRLLAGDEFPRHMAEVLDVVLMERKGKAAEANRRAHGWFDYLQSSVASNRPWDQMVADLITARPKSPQQNGAAWFLYERKNNYQSMAEAVAPVAFGASVACAQCHNHPLAHEIKQQHYWGLVAAFNRSTNVDVGGGAALSEAATGGFINFTNLKKESQPAVLAFPNDKTVVEHRPADGAAERDSDDNYLIPPKDKAGSRQAAVPKFSRRQALADAVTHDNPLLARAFVNRTWALLLGRGLVHPVDQMDSRHPPSHPELLSWLARDFESSGYDIKHLFRTIVLSRTYQLDSRWAGPTPPAPDLYARGPEKPLSAEVLYRSLLVATGQDAAGQDAGAKEPADTKPDTEPLRQALIAAFPSLFEAEYNATLQQAMFLTNSPLLDALVQPHGHNLTARLLELKTSRERAEAAFVEILGRMPDDAERAGAVAYLDARQDRPEAGVRQLVWALLSGSEFLLNH